MLYYAGGKKKGSFRSTGAGLSEPALVISSKYIITIRNSMAAIITRSLVQLYRILVIKTRVCYLYLKNSVTGWLQNLIVL